MDAGGRAMQEQLPRHEGHEEIKLRVLRLRGDNLLIDFL
jgi:hypothetical protein